MIIALEGILESRGVDSAAVKVGPLSLQVYVPASTLSQLGAVGDKVYLHTHLHLREDNVAIYGFASTDELAIFQNLISVSGIGPRAALAFLSTLNVTQLASAIISGNVDLLTQVPGIGRKIAGRVVLELKGKLEKGWEGAVIPALTREDADVVTALTSLGYSLREATQAVSNLPASQDMDLEEKVKLALSQIART
ncbi:MAG: Holliday junction branch migration protein RuvA [Chloroflexi bacterium]|nr:Holliday junction branch migration protein RuvA [Chloroflexota bacterium]MBL7062193.1 Holliday junction branch migration protein RuvA [Dehalococcoidia bacterium]